VRRSVEPGERRSMHGVACAACEQARIRRERPGMRTRFAGGRRRPGLAPVHAMLRGRVGASILPSPVHGHGGHLHGLGTCTVRTPYNDDGASLTVAGPEGAGTPARARGSAIWKPPRCARCHKVDPH